MVVDPSGNATYMLGNRPKSGFTLVELLVTITIIAMLVGMVVPALGMAREAARRSTCLNNAKELATALLHFETTNGELPGWRDTIPAYSNSAAVQDTQRCVSWTIPILPELGNNELFGWYDEFSSDADPSDDPQPDGKENYNTLKQKRVPVFGCPTAYVDPSNQGVFHYAANAGTKAEVLADPDSNTGNDDQTQFRGDGIFVDRVGNDGSVSLTGRIKYKASRSNPLGGAGLDGDSTTLLLAERSGAAQELAQVFWAQTPRPAITNGVYDGSTYSELLSDGDRAEDGYAIDDEPHTFGHPPRLGDEPPKPSSGYRVINSRKTDSDVAPLGADDWPFRFPSSQHSAKGATAAFCDGHVRFLSETIDSWVYCQMLTSSQQNLSPHAAKWQQYDHDRDTDPNDLVKYIFDEKDLEKK